MEGLVCGRGLVDVDHGCVGSVQIITGHQSHVRAAGSPALGRGPLIGAAGAENNPAHQSLVLVLVLGWPCPTSQTISVTLACTNQFLSAGIRCRRTRL